MSFVGLCFTVVAILMILSMFYILLSYLFAKPRDHQIEQVDIIEGGSIVEQQRWGRELWRQVEVEIPNRPLCYEEELNLKSILKSGNGNVKIVTPPPPPPDEPVGEW